MRGILHRFHPGTIRDSALVASAATAVYANTLLNGFVYDDRSQIVENAWIRDFGNVPRMFVTGVWEFEGGVSNYYRPVMLWIYTAVYHVFGLRAWGYHLVSVILHAAVSLLVLLTIRHVLYRAGGESRTSPQAALAGALLFAVHPAGTEAVAWVAGVPELTYSLFLLLALLLHSRDGDGLWKSRTAALAAFAFAAISKETALVFPALIFTYEMCLRGSSATRAVARTAPYVAVAAAYLLLRMAVLPSFAPLERHRDLDRFQIALNAFPLFAGYLGKLVAPVRLNAFHVLHPISSLLAPIGLLSIAAAVGFAALAVVSFVRWRPLVFGLAATVLPLAPVLYIPALGENTFAERYLYLPVCGLALIVALVVAAVRAARPGWTPVLTALLAGLVGLGGLATVRRNAVWRSDLALWTDTVRKSPDSAFARNELGISLAEAGRMEDAVEEYRAALRLRPDFARALNNLGTAHAALGRGDEAIAAYAAAIRSDPRFARAHNNLGMSYARAGQLDRAVEEYRAALSLDPGSVEVLLNLGNALVERGSAKEAVEVFRMAVRRQPDSADAHLHLGIALGQAGKLDEAISDLEAALALGPNDPFVHHNLANAYRLRGETGRAEAHLRRAREIEETLRVGTGR